MVEISHFKKGATFVQLNAAVINLNVPLWEREEYRKYAT
jgi:hypothetical protein